MVKLSLIPLCRTAVFVYSSDIVYIIYFFANSVYIALIRLVKEKLIENQTADEILSGLKISAEPVKILSGGAYKVSATVEAEKEFVIFGDVPAVADGTIIAHVLDDGQKIGTANMVLPFNGVEGVVKVAGMGLSGAENGKEYTVTFSADKL